MASPEDALSAAIQKALDEASSNNSSSIIAKTTSGSKSEEPSSSIKSAGPVSSLKDETPPSSKIISEHVSDLSATPYDLREGQAKKELTIVIPCKKDINGVTVLSLISAMMPLTQYFRLKIEISPGKSNIVHARSVLLTRWYDATENDPDALFLFIDADQTFTIQDIFRVYNLNADVGCGSYVNSRGNVNCFPKDQNNWINGKNTNVYYSATGFMMIRRRNLEKVVDFIKAEFKEMEQVDNTLQLVKTKLEGEIAKPILNKILASVEKEVKTKSKFGNKYRFWISHKDNSIIPFFQCRYINSEMNKGSPPEWLGEDYAFCWLVRQAGLTLRTARSSTIGHNLSTLRYFEPEKQFGGGGGGGGGARNKKPKKWEPNTIVYYAGQSRITFSPESLKTGIGGSETAIIQLSKWWQRRGYMVTVYGTVKPGCYEGVMYKDSKEFNPNDKFYNLIMWRGAAINMLPHVEAVNLLYDLHDPGESYLPYLQKYFSRINKIMVKGQYHRTFMEDIPDDKICIIPNGVDDSLFNHLLESPPKRNPYRIIYASSYDRGLVRQLQWGWPIIKKNHPKAEFHIYYGMELIRNANLKALLQQLLALPGVVDHGRVGQAELLQAKAESSIHYYMCSADCEIDCITLKESAAVGCVPVVSTFAVFSLEERPNYCHIEGDVTKQETHVKAAEKICQLLSSKKQLEMWRRKCMPKEGNYNTWKETAVSWSEQLPLSPVFVIPELPPLAERPPLKGFSKAYVLNMKRRPDRLHHFYQKVPFNPKICEVFEALDGSTLDLNDEKVKKLTGSNDYRNNPGAIGCTISHYDIWQKIVKDDNIKEDEMVLVFEDDVFFYSDFVDCWNNEQWNCIPKDCDVLYFQLSRPDPIDKFPEVYHGPRIGKGGRDDGKFLEWIEGHVHAGTFSYGITKKAARKLVEIADTKSMIKPVDQFMTSQVNKITMYGSKRASTYSILDHDTDIQGYRPS